MARQRNLMGTLLSTFKFERDEARKKATKDLWARNGMANEKTRQGYEVREQEILTKSGEVVLISELWQKLDEENISISAKIETKALAQGKVEKVEAEEETDEFEDLL